MLPILKVCGKSGDYPSPAPPRPPGSLPRRRPRQKRRRLRSAAQEPPVVLNFSLKMADPTFAGTTNGTSLRGLRERLVAVAQELAEERRRKRGLESSAVSLKKSSCTPVLDGSVLKNDVKQQLAKERREEQKRQQEANKEKQLLEKEQKAKLQYEKQLEEKHRKLKEQKEKDERRRASAEEKRKQKQAEDKEKFKAVVSRTMERCNLIDKRQKRWSWEGSVMNTDKSGKPENKRSSSMSRKENQLQTSGDLQHVNNRPSMTKYVFRYVTVPMFTSEELKSSAMFCKPSAKAPVTAKLEVTPIKKVETPLKGDVEGPAKVVNLEIPPKITIEVPSPTNLEEPSEGDVEVKLQNMEDISKVKVEISPEADVKVSIDENIARYPKPNVEELPSVSMDASSSIEPSSTVSEDSFPSPSTASSSFVSVEISPVVSLDASPETSIDASPESSMDSGSMEVALGNNLEAPLQASEESYFDESVQEQPQNPEMDKRNVNLNLTTKKQAPCHIPCYRWPSSPALGWRPPSPLKALQSRKIRPPSPLPVSSRLSTKTSLSYRITPVQNILYVPNALGIIAAKKDNIQKHMIQKESGYKSMPSGEVAKKALVQVQHAAYEQKGKKEKERVQKEEIKQSIARKSEVMEKKLNEVPAGESSPRKDEQREKDPTKPLLELPEDQKEQLQKGDSAMMNPHDSAEQRKKEQERIMLQNWQERLERKKRVEEIMKWTRKTDENTSKASEISSSSEDDADDEDETGSEDSVEMLPSGRKMSMKHKKFHKYAKMKPQKLVFLQAGTGEVDTEKNVYFNGDVKDAKQKDPKYSTIQAKVSKISTKRPPTRPIRSRKIKEGGTTIRPTQSVTTSHQWFCDKLIDLSHTTESPVVKTTPGNNKQSSTDPKISHQGPQAPADHKKRVKAVSAPLTEVFSHLHIAGRATNLEHPFASSYSRLAFGGEVEDSDV
ncbi:MAP7 domain-containing protein 3 isoform X2 [Rattus norvegicus]|uniref:MAP7 domain containing 3 n=1 Tax=Rattus norvegicus TaxID=10116 RepID=A0ABK0LEZ9_RAT|nr:MAP7 domain-containing protein 3 isoform X2 [Rattus norvegicus]|eukprot:XP_017457586.1 PREDICTED: MAP7 domain-containing protein 3 isoform X3 [Rattus norvegicus]